MPEGGTLTIETGDVERRRREPPAPGVARRVVRRADRVATRASAWTTRRAARIFEPFFTTKGGHGHRARAGDGLRHRQAERWPDPGVAASSGRGTTFKVFLPRAQAPSAAVALPRQPRARAAGRETVLLVEDEVLVRAVLKKALVGAGYRVLEAANAEDASLVHERPRDDRRARHRRRDARQDGPELARQLTSIRPSLKVLYMSGYAPNAPRARVRGRPRRIVSAEADHAAAAAVDAARRPRPTEMRLAPRGAPARHGSLNAPCPTSTACPPTSTLSSRSLLPRARACRVDGLPISAPC